MHIQLLQQQTVIRASLLCSLLRQELLKSILFFLGVHVCVWGGSVKMLVDIFIAEKIVAITKMICYKLMQIPHPITVEAVKHS